MTKDFHQIVNIMTPGTGLYVLWCINDSHIVKVHYLLTHLLLYC